MHDTKLKQTQKAEIVEKEVSFISISLNKPSPHSKH